MTAAIHASGVSKHVSSSGDSLCGPTRSGLELIILAFTMNYEAIQNYNTKQMSLGASLADAQQKEAKAQIAAMQTKLEELTQLSKEHWTWDKEYNAAVSAATSALNVMNSKFNQMNTLYNGMVQGVNQNSSDTTQTLQTDLQMIGTNGVLATLQTIAQCV